MSSQKPASTTRKITLGLIVGWVLGIFILLPAISLLTENQLLAGFSLLAASLILLPPSIAFIQKKGQFQLSGGVKFILVVVLFGIAAGNMDMEQVSNEAKQPSATESAVQDSNSEKSYQEIFTFEGNGAKNSESFTTTGDKFKIVYSCSGSLCQAWLKSPEGGQLDIIMNGEGPINDESIFYNAGTYYIESNSIGEYTMSVQDYR